MCFRLFIEKISMNKSILNYNDDSIMEELEVIVNES